MLEHLGLGIVLDLEDNFTPQANSALASFDRLQSGAEEMQESIGKSLSNLQNLMLSGFSLDTIGESVKNAGKSILNTFKSLGSELINTNSMFDTLKAQMLTVFGSVEETNKKLEWATNFAVKTPFDVEGTVRAMQMMKSQGLDVTKEFKNAKGEMKSFLEYMGDFATRNMSSTGGFEGMAYAISNALGGDFTSIRKRFDLSKTESDNLKEIFNTGGIEAFADAFTDLADRLTPNAMRNMLGTWDQIMAEMEETWGVFLWKVGDTGAFDAIKRTVLEVSKSITGLTSDGNVKAFGDIVSSLWKPIDFLVRGLNKVVQGVLAFTEKHPQIGKIGAGFVAVTGIVLTLSGVLMKATGGIMIFATSIVSAWANLSVLGSLGVASNLTGLTTGIMSVVKWLGLAGVAVGAFALAWHNNFMGVRDRGLTVFNQLKEAWSMSEIYFDKDFDVKYQKQLKMEMNLETDGSMKQLNNVAYKIAQFRALATGVLKALFRPKGDNGKIFFTDEEIAVFENTGILLTIQKIVALRERVVTFFKGFGEGISSVIAIGERFLNVVLTPVKAFFHAIGVNLRPIKEFFDSIFGFKEFPIPEEVARKQLENLKKLGQAVGAVFGAVMGFKIVSSLTSFIVSPFKKLFDNLVKVKDTVWNVKDALLGLKSKTISVVANTVGLDSVTGSNDGTQKKPTIMQTIFGKTEQGTYAYDDAKEYAKSQIRTPIIPKSQAKSSNHDGYSQVYGNQMDSSFYQLRFQDTSDKSLNANRIFVEQQKGLLGNLKQKLFGDKYFTESYKDGVSTLNQKGNFGGLLNVEHSDNQLRLANQKFRANGGYFEKLNPSKYITGYNKVNKDGSLGEHINFDFNNKYNKYNENADGEKVLNRNWLKKEMDLKTLRNQMQQGKVKVAYDSNVTQKYKDSLLHAIDVDPQVGKLGNFTNGAFDKQKESYLTSIEKRNQEIKNNPFKVAGVDTRKYNAPKYKTVSNVDEETGEVTKSQILNPTWIEKQKQKQLDAKALTSDLFKNDSVLNQNRDALGQINKAEKQTVFKEDRANWKDMLFGQKYYKIDEDENGNLYKNTIARKGGLLRMGGNLREKDENGVMNRDKIVYNEEGKLSNASKFKNLLGGMTEEFKNSQFMSTLKNFPSNVKEVVTSLPEKLGSFIKSLPQTIGSFISSIPSKIASGVGTITSKIGEVITGIPSKIGNITSKISTSVGNMAKSLTSSISNSRPVVALKELGSSLMNSKPVLAIKDIASSIANSKPVVAVREFASSIANSKPVLAVKEFANTIANSKPIVAIKELVSTIANTKPSTLIKSLVDSIANSKPVTAIKDLMNAIANSKPITAIKDFLSLAKNNVVDYSSKAKDKIVSGATTLKNNTIERATNLRDDVKLKAGVLKNNVMTSTPVLQARGYASIAKDKIKSLPSNIMKAPSTIRGAISNVRQAPSSLKTRIMTSTPVLQARGTASALKNKVMTSTPVLQARGYASIAKDKVANSRVVRAYQNQKNVLGFGRSNTPRVSTNAPQSKWQSFKATTSNIGSKLFGRGTKNEATGKTTGGGFFTKVARGTGSVLGTTGKIAKSGIGVVGRTAGLVGRGAMAMLPGAMAVGAIGSAFYRGVANKGSAIQGEDRQKLIKDAKLAPDASNFTVGLAQFKKELKSVDVKSMWTKLKTEGKSAWNLVRDIGKDMWKQIKDNGSTILSEAFEGIKGLAGIAWEWIKTDGIDLFFSMSESAYKLIGKAFTWLGEHAGQIFGGIAEFVVGTVLPKMLGAVTQLGTYIITHLPEIFTTLVSIAGGIFKGLLTMVTGIFTGIGKFLFEAISGAFSGIGKALLSALAVPIRAIPVVGDPVADALGLPVHHKGLWMSEEEHPAIIRKDETVLPPDISRKFNSVFNTQSDILEAKKEARADKSNTPTNVDNSVRIDKVEIVVKADKLSRSDAREQAKMILEEFKKINNENKIRAYL